MKPEKESLYSLFSHRGRVHIQFPPDWVKEPPLYSYEDDPSDGPVAYIYFTSIGAAYRLYEDWSGAQAGFGQPVPMVQKINPKGVSWSKKAPKIFEPLNKVRVYGGSNEPILLSEIR